MSYYGLGDSFRWFISRVVDINDPEKLGRVKIRIIHDQTGELGEKKKTFGLEEEELLWAYPISAIQSASLSYKKINELEYDDGDFVPDWIDAVGLSPTGIAIGTYAFGFYIDGHEANIPMIFGTYHKVSMYPEPGKDPQKMLQEIPPNGETYEYHDVSALAKGVFTDPLGRQTDGETKGSGQILPKEPYTVNSLWTPNDKTRAPVDEFPTAYGTEYPYNLTYTTKSGHAIEIDDSPGHERIHIWHRSGCYEEISNGPTPLIDDDKLSKYPKEGPSGYNYITAGGVQENDYIGRRNRKTMDTFFDTIGKDYNLLVKRDHNVEIANTVTTKIGNTKHITVGWKQPPQNRVNDDGKTPYSGGGIDKYSLYLDVANNTIQTSTNNMVISVGATPSTEHRLTDKDVGNQYIQVGNNQMFNVGNNQFFNVGGNQTFVVGDNFRLTVGSDSNITIEGECNVTVGSGVKLKGDVTVFGQVTVDGKLGQPNGTNSGTFTSADGKLITVIDGVIQNII